MPRHGCCLYLLCWFVQCYFVGLTHNLYWIQNRSSFGFTRYAIATNIWQHLQQKVWFYLHLIWYVISICECVVNCESIILGAKVADTVWSHGNGQPFSGWHFWRQRCQREWGPGGKCKWCARAPIWNNSCRSWKKTPTSWVLRTSCPPAFSIIGIGAVRIIIPVHCESESRANFHAQIGAI